MEIKKSWHDIKLVAHYESKLIKRDFLFWILVFLTLGVITCYQAVKQGSFGWSTTWCLISMPSSMPLVNAYLFNIFQSFILVFVCTNLYRRERRADTLQVIYIRPLSNTGYTLGKALGIGCVFLIVNICSLVIALFINLFASRAPVNLFLYFYYFFTLSLPSLFFILGFSFFVVRGVKHAILGLLILLICLSGVLFVLPSVGYGMADILGISLPNFFSRITGHPFAGNIISQRFAIFLTGLLFLLVSAELSDRLFNGRKDREGVACSSLFLLLLAGGLAWNYYYFYYWAEVAREEYRSVFLEYETGEKAHVERHEIFYNQQGSRLRLMSNITITNPHEKRLDSVILYLNPGLEIGKFTERGKPVLYSRDHQVVVVKRKLFPSDTLQFIMEYEGWVDENVCYVDKPLRVSGTYGDTPFRFGQRYCYVEKNYTLLLPEILWYPSAMPPTNIRYPEIPRLDFTSYTLHVPREKGRSVITQGINFYNEKEVVFRSVRKYPGLTLCIGDYKKKEMWMGKYTLELYYFKKHDFFESFPLLDKREVREIINELSEQNSLMEYPHERLCLVESPISFFTPIREWKGTSDFVQPGIVFLPEQGTTMERDAFTGKIKLQGREEEDEDYLRMVKQRDRLKGLIQGTLFNSSNTFYEGNTPVERLFSRLANVSRESNVSSRDVKYLFFDYSYGLHCPEIPVLDHALRVMKRERNIAYRQGSFSPFRNNLVFLSYLSKNSLESALQDSSLSIAFRENLIKLKVLDLHAYLRSHIPGDGLYEFLADFWNENRYKKVTLEQFNAALVKACEVDLFSFLDTWYRDTCMPSFEVREVTCGQMADDLLHTGLDSKDWRIHFKVYNRGKIGGSIVTLLPSFGIQPEYEEEDYFWIPTGECKEIKLAYKGAVMPHRLTVSTGIAANLPDYFEYSYPGKENLSVTSDQSTGIFDCDPEVFHDNPDEIVVDNEDPCFRLIEGEKHETLASLRNRKEKYRDFMKVSSRWQYTLWPYFYGREIRSACLKLVGDGSAKAEWTAEIQKDGVYEIFTRYMEFGTTRLSTVLPDVKLYYTVVHDHRESEVILEINDGDDPRTRVRGGEGRWLSLGEFELHAGKVKVIVDDRGERSDDGKQLIFADAVKFVRKK